MMRSSPHLGSRIGGQDRFPPPVRMSSYFQLKWGVQIPCFFHENQTPRSDPGSDVRNLLAPNFCIPPKFWSPGPHPVLSSVGVDSDHDPLVRGCAVNERSRGARPPVVERVASSGLLSYVPFAADVALLRGTVADTDGNVSFADEAVLADALAQARLHFPAC